jgi:hypothetical protein
MNKKEREAFQKKRLSEFAKKLKKEQQDLNDIHNRERAEWDRYKSQHRTW